MCAKARRGGFPACVPPAAAVAPSLTPPPHPALTLTLCPDLHPPQACWCTAARACLAPPRSSSPTSCASTAGRPRPRWRPPSSGAAWWRPMAASGGRCAGWRRSWGWRRGGRGDGRAQGRAGSALAARLNLHAPNAVHKLAPSSLLAAPTAPAGAMSTRFLDCTAPMPRNSSRWLRHRPWRHRPERLPPLLLPLSWRG